MITLAERRRVGRFADLVDDEIEVNVAPELEPLLSLARTLQRVPLNVDIDPEFRAKLRTRVVAMSAVHLPAQSQAADASGSATQRAGGPARAAGQVKERALRPASARSRPQQLPPSRRLVVIGAAMACMLLLAGVGAASRGTVVGNPLYGVKRATEATQLKLAGSDTDRGRRYLSLARTRLAEARKVKGDQQAVLDTLAAMDQATLKGTRLLTGVAANNQDRAPLDSLDKFAAAQRTALGSLLSNLPAGPVRERVVQSLVLVERLSSRSIALRATLVCPAAASPADDLGPRPTGCAAAAPGSTQPGSATQGPNLNGLPGPAGTDGAGALPGTRPAPGTGGKSPAAVPPATGAVGAVGGIVDDIVGSLGGGGTTPSPAPPLLPLPLPSLQPLPLPSVIPTLPPLLPGIGG